MIDNLYEFSSDIIYNITLIKMSKPISLTNKQLIVLNISTKKY